MDKAEIPVILTEEHLNALLLRAAGGDSTALNELFSHERAFLRNRIIPNGPVGISISVDIQEAMIQAAVSLPTLRVKTLAVFRSWLLTILRNKIRERHRKRRHDDSRNSTVTVLSEDIADESLPPDEQIANDELDALLLKHIDSLSDDQRHVIWMYHFEGLPTNTIAEVLERTNDAVHGLLNRGRKKLRDLLGDAYDS